MNWRHETWRKLYVREQGSFASLSYSARALAAMLLKLVDDRGRLVTREGEDVAAAVCFRMRASRTERRLIRAAIDELLEDGYLVPDGRGVRIRNFSKVHGEDVAIEPPSVHDRDGTDARPVHEPVVIVSPSVHEPVAISARPSREDRVNSAKPIRSPSVVPSFRSVPEVPAREDPPRGDEGASSLLQLFCRIRKQVSPDCFDWNATGQGVWAAAEQTSEYLEAHPEAHEDVAETMRRVVKDARDKRDTNGPNVLFGRWASKFTELREELHGVRDAALPGLTDRERKSLANTQLWLSRTDADDRPEVTR